MQALDEYGDVWDVGAKHGGRLKRVQRGEIKRRGEKPAFACFVAGRTGRPAEIAASSEDDEQLKMGRIGCEFAPLGKIQPLSREIAASTKKLSVTLGGAEIYMRNLAAMGKAELDHVERLFDVKLARLAVGVVPVIVIDAIGNVGIFLNFADHHVGANGVRHSRGNEEGIARVNFVWLKDILQVMAGERLQEYLPAHSGFQTSQQPRSSLSRSNVPHLSFTAAARRFFVYGGVIIIWVNLDGQFVLREYEFHEEREVRDRVEPTAPPFNRHFVPRRSQGLSRVRTGCDLAVQTSEPDLPKRLRDVRFFRKQRSE